MKKAMKASPMKAKAMKAMKAMKAGRAGFWISNSYSASCCRDPSRKIVGVWYFLFGTEEFARFMYRRFSYACSSV